MPESVELGRASIGGADGTRCKWELVSEPELVSESEPGCWVGTDGNFAKELASFLRSG